MPDCSYCGDSFDSENAYLAHLETAHADELGPIDQRRVGDDDETSFGIGSVAFAALVVLPVAAVAYVLFFTGGGAGGGNALPTPERTPSNVATHQHGTINVTIAGNELDFSREKFQNPGEYPDFHFEGGNGDVWHAHAEGVTLQYAMRTLGIGVTNDTVIYDGQTYTEDNATVIVEVNGEPVDPTEYVLSGASDTNPEAGDHIRILVRPD